MPKWIVPAFITLVVLSLIPAGLITYARSTRSSTPRINLVPDMDYQLKYLPQTENALFVDGRAMRPAIEGTVARGAYHEDEAFWTGRAGDDWVTGSPAAGGEELLARGQERFGIYCAVCHGVSGRGDGPIHQRATKLATEGLANWVPPSSLLDDLVRNRPDGHIFNTISYGIRNMPAYGPQIDPADRWAIVAWVRELQSGRVVDEAGVPADAHGASPAGHP